MFSTARGEVGLPATHCTLYGHEDPLLRMAWRPRHRLHSIACIAGSCLHPIDDYSLANDHMCIPFPLWECSYIQYKTPIFCDFVGL